MSTQMRNGVRHDEYGESWTVWATVTNDEHLTSACIKDARDPEDYFERLTAKLFGDSCQWPFGAYNGGPGQAFQHAPTIRFSPGHILLTGNGGLDV